jgi:enamine deaminase RidA (YjgF/YER057c/UK114 family)
MYGATGGNGEAEILEIFDRMRKLLEKTGSDFRHLVKATYYVTTDATSARLTELRPRFYDANRPPAASKAPVTGTGLPGKTITLDMIAVPVTAAK